MKHLSTIIRWMARVLGVGAVVLFVNHAIGQRLPDPLVLDVEERVLYGAFALMLIGVLGAWVWEVIGALVTFGGYGLLWYLETSLPEPVFSVFPLAACLFLIAWLLDHQPIAKSAAPVQKKKAKKRARR
jgi:hypothetical protein